MAFTLTEKARIEADKINKEPQIVLEINGLDTKFGAVSLKKYVRIGDDNLFIGNDWVIGGFNEVEDSSPYITFSKGTSTRLQQSIDQDKGETSSITSMSITVIDKNQEVSALLKRDTTQTPTFDLLGREVTVWYGFKESGWKEDYIVIFRGVIESTKASAGFVTFNLNAADKIIDSELFPKVELETSASFSASASAINVTPVALLDNLIDPSTPGFFGAPTGFNLYAQLEDEIIKVNSIGASGFTSISRAQLGTTAASGTSGVNVSCFYEIQGAPMDIVKRLLMCVQTEDPAEIGNRYVNAATGFITSIRRITTDREEINGLYFQGINLVEEYGARVGDLVTLDNPDEPLNDFSSKQIGDIEITEDGSTIIYVVEEFTDTPLELVEQIDCSNTVLLLANFDSGRWAVGLGMSPKLLDLDQIDKMQNRFFSSTLLSFYIKDTMNVREFIEQKLFKPLSLYRIPRKGRFSVKYHFPPLPDEPVPVLNADNVVNPASISIERSTSKNFYNTVIIRYNEDVLEDKFNSGYITINEDSKNEIAVGTKAFTIDAPGFRTDKIVDGSQTNGENYAATAADRRLKKYAFGAEYIRGMKVNFKTGFALEIGDIVNVDLTALKITDIKSGTRAGDARLFEIENKTLNLQTGEIEIDLVDTNFNLDARYALMSPASKIKTGLSQSQFVIKPSASQTPQFGANEWRKWNTKIGASVRIRSNDFSVCGVGTIQSVQSNTVTLSSNLGFTPSEDYWMELSPYTTQDTLITNLYGFMNQSVSGTMTNGDDFYRQV